MNKAKKISQHADAYRRCPWLPLDALFELTRDPTDRWRAGTHGDRFCRNVLIGERPHSVRDCIAAAKLHGFSEGETQGHLRWLYTFTDSPLSLRMDRSPRELLEKLVDGYGLPEVVVALGAICSEKAGIVRIDGPSLPPP